MSSFFGWETEAQGKEWTGLRFTMTESGSELPPGAQWFRTFYHLQCGEGTGSVFHHCTMALGLLDRSEDGRGRSEDMGQVLFWEVCSVAALLITGHSDGQKYGVGASELSLCLGPPLVAPAAIPEGSRLLVSPLSASR